MRSEEVFARLAALHVEQDKLLAESFDELTHAELLTVLDELTILERRQPVVERTIVARLVGETSPVELGGKSWADVLSRRLRISPIEARRRLDDAEDLGPRTALSGEPLAPKLPMVAEAQRRGEIGLEHIRVIRKFFAELPDRVDRQAREPAEADLARVAAGLRPDELRKAADRLAYLLNQDGEFTDRDRARKRSLSIGKQGADGMSEIRGLLDPQARATLDAVLAKWAAPGMCNPDDQSPCVADTPSEQAIHTDARSPGQRNHDALTALGRAMLASGQLGQHKGLPSTIIVATTLQELESGCGQAVTAGGSLLPMSDVIRLASHSYHYLAIFDRHTGAELYLARTRRAASAGQRIVLHAKDRGCTFPGCTARGYECEAHHVTDWAKGGLTNIDTLTLACAIHNRFVKQGGWTTRQRIDGRTEWIPPPALDGGQTRVNNYHHPERYLVNEDDE